MSSRPALLKHLVTTIGVSFIFGLSASAVSNSFKGDAVFNRIVTQSTNNKWSALPIGDLMGKIALEFEGTPYKEGTLELTPDREICSVNLNGLDCVTFFESTLDLAA